METAADVDTLKLAELVGEIMAEIVEFQIFCLRV